MSGYEVALKALREREAKWIKSARKFAENEFLQLIKDTMPEVDINELKFNWDDSHLPKLSLQQEIQLKKFKLQIKRDLRESDVE